MCVGFRGDPQPTGGWPEGPSGQERRITIARRARYKRRWDPGADRETTIFAAQELLDRCPPAEYGDLGRSLLRLERETAWRLLRGIRVTYWSPDRNTEKLVHYSA